MNQSQAHLILASSEHDASRRRPPNPTPHRRRLLSLPAQRLLISLVGGLALCLWVIRRLPSPA